ncbi:hypothetical protein [Bradyrhizobium betae]|uniref:Uncharacterized protein n=1 Tax=Bradyrhizobium betae TaxID=244734 RepID=A0A5P6PC98_9BRAD|nr:hypothetical protein [Bradyrhizobium betae]MCS3726463.1 hypothetical protein [Bradyrhizobium betae]QFI75534.1 hypothetical protein F8237_25945 [Bradyrhizobium betae]
MLRSVLSAVLVVTGLLPSVAACAGDYTVSYAFDSARGDDVAADATGLPNEAGTTRECWYEKYCSISLPKADLTITFTLQRSSRHQVIVYADGGRSRGAGCCYFAGGERRAAIELTQPMLYLRIYEGPALKQNEVVQSIHLGLLYLQFSDLR